MTEQTMTVNEALAKLKTLNARIEKETRTQKYIDTNCRANTKIDGVSVSDYEKRLKGNLDRVLDLIRLRTAIKQAVSQSNATTSVTIPTEDGKSITMTVAELIEYKTSTIGYLTALRDTLTSQFNKAKRVVDDNNGEALEERMNRFIASANGGSKDASADAVATLREMYIKSNAYDLIDPNNLYDQIQKLNDRIEFFQSRVDTALVASNATTVIKFTV